jgi:hypothetical protein
MEKKEASRQGKSINETIKSMGKWLYRYGVVFSVAMVVTSLLNNLGTQLVNKLGMGKERVSASVEVSGKQSYHKPVFSIFSSVVAGEAMAVVNILSS